MVNDPVQQALADLDSADLAVRIEALHQLRAHKDERIAPKVIPVLRDSHPTLRRLAAEVLSTNADTNTGQALIAILFDHEADVRAAAADALGKLADRGAVPGLMELLYDESVDARFAAAEALGLIADPRAVVDLIQVMDNDDAPLAAMAAMSLYKIGTPEALASIQHLYDGDRFLVGTETVPNLDNLPPPDTDLLPINEPREQAETDAESTVRHIPDELLSNFLRDATEPDVTRPSSSAIQGNTETAASPVQFSAYYPREIGVNVWQPMRAYIFLAAAAAAVADDAAKELGALLPSYREVERPAASTIAEGALITATPELAGFQFNPPSAQVGFYEAWQHFDFKLRAVDAPPDQASNGRISFTVEGVIVAEIPLSIYLGSQETHDAAPTAVTRPIYQSIFCCYSRQDTQIVERVERAYKALGMTFLRDVVALKSGEDWNQELLDLIDEADIFQLFWSSTSAESSSVRKEWEHALQRQPTHEGFIRPVYWQQPMPPPAPELAAIHFAYQPDLNQA